MNYMFAKGFLATKAPFFMDFTTLIVALLPLLVFFAIKVAKRGYIKLHALLQTTIFIVTVIVLGWFEYGVRVGGGFSDFSRNSSLSKDFLTIFLIIHIIISTFTIIYWAYTLFFVLKHYLNSDLKGKFLAKHIKEAKITFVGIVLTALTGTLVYIFLFII